MQRRVQNKLLIQITMYQVIQIKDDMLAVTGSYPVQFVELPSPGAFANALRKIAFLLGHRALESGGLLHPLGIRELFLLLLLFLFILLLFHLIGFLGMMHGMRVCLNLPTFPVLQCVKQKPQVTVHARVSLTGATHLSLSCSLDARTCRGFRRCFRRLGLLQ